MAKLNDWIIAGIKNPNFTVDDFIDAGLDSDNTELRTKDEYLKSKFIQNTFLKDGDFDEEAFNNYYTNRLVEFQKLNDSDFSFSYDLMDTSRKPDSKVKDIGFLLYTVGNPDRLTTGFSERYNSSTPIYSKRELAQMNQVYDPKTGEWSDEVLNDNALTNSFSKYLSFLVDEPLVYATYDEDGEHYDSLTGQMVKHSKGEFKTNRYGSYYTEKSNGRNLGDKEVVRAFDLLTVDGEGINKYDSLDSDSLDKSAYGTIHKSALSILPLVIPYAGEVYSGLMITREIAKSLPMLYGIFNSYFGDGLDSELINKLAAYGEKFSTGSSDYALQNTVSFENAANLITDVAVQWGQQKLIAKGINKLIPQTKAVQQAYGKAQMMYTLQAAELESKVAAGEITRAMADSYIGTAEKWSESALGKAAIKHFVPKAEIAAKNAHRIGADVSLMYMSMVSNTDVYQSMLDHGATKKEAATVALASMIGMFSVDKFANLGDIFIDNLSTDVERSIRATTKKEIESWTKDYLNEIAKTPESKNKLRKYINFGLNFGKKTATNFIDDLQYHSLSFMGKAVGEGLEEVSEELVTDLSKQLYEIGYDLGISSQKDVGAFENMLPRYGMSLAGGFVGGGLFAGVELINGSNFVRDTSKDELIYLISNGHTDEVLNELDKLHKQGKFGSTKLGLDYELDKDGNKIFVTKKSGQKSHNDIVYDKIKDTVLQIDAIINENRVGLSEDLLFNQMVLSEKRFLDLKNYLDLKNQSYTTGYQLNFRDLVSKLVKAEQDLTAASKTVDGTVSGEIATDEQLRHLNNDDSTKRENNLNLYREEINSIKNEIEKFKNGEYSLPYVEKLLFSIDNNINSEFISMNFEQWVKTNKNKSLDSLSPEELETYKKEYLSYKKHAQEQDLNIRFDIYKNIKKIVDPFISNISLNAPEFKKSLDKLYELMGENSPLINIKYYKWDDIFDFDGETKDSDSYINRNDLNYILERYNKFNDKNKEIFEQAKLKALSIIQEAGNSIDPATRYRLKQFLRNRNKDIVGYIKNDILAQNPELASVLNSLNTTDFSNYDEVIKALELQTKEELVDFQLFRDRISDMKNMSDLSESYDIRSAINTIKANLKSILESRGLNLDDNALDDLLFSVHTPTESSDFTADSIKEDNGEYYLSENPLLGADVEVTEEDIPVWNEILQKLRDKYSDPSADLEDFFDNFSVSTIIDSNEDINQEIDRRKQVLADYRNRILTDSQIDLNNQLDKLVSGQSPVKDFLKNLAVKFNKNTPDLISLLDKLDKLYDSIESIEDFVLSAEEQETADELIDLINKARVYLKAALNLDTDLSRHIGHNKTINDFAKNHKSIYPNFEELPTIDLDTFNIFNREFLKYLNVLGEYIPEVQLYTSGSWRDLSSKNAINKALQFVRAKLKWNESLIDYFTTNRDAFRIVIGDKQYDLLKDFETIPINKEKAALTLNKLQHLLYTNFLNLLKEGITIDLIFSTDLITRIANIDKIVEQLNTKLDDKVNYGNITDYDKLTILCTFLSLDSNEWNKFIRTRIDEESDIVPLSILQWVSRVACAYTKNKEVFRALFKAIHRLAPDKNLPDIDGVFVKGGAGVGKSSVVAKNVARFISSQVKDPEIWLSAPKESQKKTLLESVGSGVTMLNNSGENSLISRICDTNLLKELLEDLENDKESKYYTLHDVNGSRYINVNTNLLGIKKLDKAPNLIIIDEATHLSNVELLIISAFAKLNNSSVLYLGDEKQNGNSANSIPNIRREICFVTRTQELSLSLRDNNIQHLDNLITVLALLETLSDATNEESRQILPLIVLRLKNLHLKVYNDSELNGDLIVPELTEMQVSKLSGSVGYVGNNSSVVSKLTAAGLEVTQLPETDIQGQEFDYVIIDKTWELDGNSVYPTYQFITDLYTMISRGRKGSILLSGQLSSLIGENKVESVLAKAPDIKDSITTFKENEISELDEIIKGIEPDPVTNNEKEEKSSVTDISKNKTLKFDLTLKEGLYSFNWINKHEGNPIGVEISWDGKNIICKIGYILNNKLIPLPENSKVWDFLEIEVENGKIKPNKLIFNTETSELIAYTDNSNYKLDKNPYNSLLDIPIKQKEASSTGSQLIENPVTSPFIGDIHEDSLDSYDKELNFDDDVLVYGNATLTGYEVSIDNGAEVWTRPEPNEVLSDLQIFTSSEVIKETSDLIKLSNRLKNFKHNFLYGRTYDELSEEDKALISKEEYDSMHYYFEVRPQVNSDLFIRNIGMKTDKLGINGLVYTVIGEFTNKEGKKCKITIGLVGSPKTFTDSVSKIQTKINRKIDKLRDFIKNSTTLTSKEKEDYENRIKELEKRVNAVPTRAKNFTKFMELVESKAKNSDNHLKFEIPKPKFSGMTSLRRSDIEQRFISYKKAQIKALLEDINTRYKRQSLKLAALEKVRLLESDIEQRSFLSLNPYTTVSDIYVYTGNVDNVDSSVIGKKAVVFVTNDESLNKEDLVDVYLSQKNSVASGQESKARVRMVPLDNLGVSWDELTSPWHKALMQTTESFTDALGNFHQIKNIAPFKTDYMGLRMYVSLWNFRANILDFNKKLSNFVNEKGLNLEKLENYSIVKDLLYKRDISKEKLDAKESELVKVENTEEFKLYSDYIEEFNERLNGTTKLFRLGGGYKNGFYIRKIVNDNSLSAFYGNVIPNGIFVTPSKAIRLEQIASSLFTNVLDNIVEVNGIDKDTLISSSKNAKNSLEGKYKSALSSGLVTIDDDNTTINFESTYDDSILNVFKNIPAVLMKTEKFINTILAYPDSDDTKAIKITKDNEVQKTIPWLDMYNELYSKSSDFGEEMESDDITNFFRLCFHGTVQDIHDPDVLKCSDALFPEGLYIDPMTSTELVKNNDRIAFKKCLTNPIFFGVNVFVDDPTFYINFNELNEAFKAKSKLKVEQTNPFVELFNKMLPILSQLNISLDVTPDEINEEFIEALEETIKLQISDNLVNLFTVQADLNALVFYDKGEIKSLEQLIRETFKTKYNKELGSIDTITMNNNTIEISTEDTSIKVTQNKMTGGISVEIDGGFVNPLIILDLLPTAIQLVEDITTKFTNKQDIKAYKDKIKQALLLIETLVKNEDFNKANSAINNLISAISRPNNIHETLSKISTELKKSCK